MVPVRFRTRPRVYWITLFYMKNMHSIRKYGKPFGVFILLLLSGCSGGLCDCAPKDGPLEPARMSPIDGKEMRLVPAGSFIMGTNKTDSEDTHQKIGTVKPLYLDQHPERQLTLDAYYIDKYEITNTEYKRFVDATQFPDYPTHWENVSFPEEIAAHPVTNITWREAFAYCAWADRQLPTEAQWEKAARGPSGQPYPWGDEYEKGKANMGIEGDRKTMPVGSYPSDVSPYGVFDLAGNVMEWARDWYAAYPGNSFQDPRFGTNFKVLRGNAFQKAGHYFLDAYRYAFNRTEVPADEYFENVGFRCATDPIPEKK